MQIFTQTAQLTGQVGVKVIINLQNLTYDLPVRPGLHWYSYLYQLLVQVTNLAFDFPRQVGMYVSTHTSTVSSPVAGASSRRQNELFSWPYFSFKNCST